MLLHIPAVLSRDQVADMRRRLDQSSWVDGRATVGAQGAQVKQNRQLPETSPLGLELGQVILAALRQNALFFSAALPLRTIAPLFNCYAEGEHYGNHVDGSVRRIPGSAQWLRTDVSSTLFLSDTDEYDGGELVVEDVYGSHEIKLPAGDLVVYPASSLHMVTPVTRGMRVASFFWLQSMIRDAHARSLIFDLDTAIQALVERLGRDDHETVKLTGIYHNLIRYWAEV